MASEEPVQVEERMMYMRAREWRKSIEVMANEKEESAIQKESDGEVFMAARQLEAKILRETAQELRALLESSGPDEEDETDSQDRLG
jgi:hypothetical protein